MAEQQHYQHQANTHPSSVYFCDFNTLIFHMCYFHVALFLSRGSLSLVLASREVTLQYLICNRINSRVVKLCYFCFVCEYQSGPPGSQGPPGPPGPSGTPGADGIDVSI